MAAIVNKVHSKSKSVVDVHYHPFSLSGCDLINVESTYFNRCVLSDAAGMNYFHLKKLKIKLN